MSHNQSFCTIDDLRDIEDFLIETRRRIHRNPELSFHEKETAELVAGHLQSWGYEVARGIGGHGVVGSLATSTDGPTVAIRADMDALPIQEDTHLPYASQNAGVMHACGHDGHTAVLLGAARQLARTRNFSGTVRLIFQPAEEAGRGGGAERMIADGLFERFPCDAIFGLHNHPGRPSGTLMFRSGAFMAAVDMVYITIHGKGGHAARPHQTVDPIVVAGSLVMALQSIVSRNVNPLETAVVTIGALNSGSAPNVIPESATMKLCVRSFSEAVRAQLRERITALVTSHAEGYGAQVETDYQEGYPVLVNSERETRLAQTVAEELVGPDNVAAPFERSTGSEDFACYLQHKPGCFLRLGNGRDSASLHSPAYNFNDDSLLVGAAYWTRLVERYLAQSA